MPRKLTLGSLGRASKVKNVVKVGDMTIRTKSRSTIDGSDKYMNNTARPSKSVMVKGATNPKNASYPSKTPPKSAMEKALDSFDKGPMNKGRVAGPAERAGRKYGTKIGRTIDKGINAIDSGVQSVGRSARSGATRVKGMAMDLHGEAQQRKFSGYDMLKAGAAGVAGYGIGQGLASKWSEHKRKQRGY